MKIIGTYGSLKKGCYNYQRFEMDKNAKYLGATKITGAMDLMAGMYPRLYPKGYMESHETEHDLEIYEISDNLCSQLGAMEAGAGYLAHKIEWEGKEVIVWLMNPEYEIDMEAYIESYPPKYRTPLNSL